MGIEIKKIDPASIPPAKGGIENKTWQDAVVAFVKSKAQAVEVLGETEGRKTSTGLRGAIRGSTWWARSKWSVGATASS